MVVARPDPYQGHPLFSISFLSLLYYPPYTEGQDPHLKKGKNKLPVKPDL